MSPKFEVGEVVILQSKMAPQYNGEYEVYAILENGSEFKCRLSGYIIEFDCQTDYGYVFTEPLSDPDDGCECVFSEGALRKKHIPGELSFTDLMASLSSPKLLTHSPQ